MILVLQVGPTADHVLGTAKPRLFGAAIIVVLLWHASTKRVPLLSEMFWACNCAALVVAVGCLAGSLRLVKTGTLFNLGVGLPGYLLDTAMSASTTVSSATVHVLPLICGGLVLRRCGYRERVFLTAWLALVGLVLASHFWLPGDMNVNLSQRAWPHAPEALSHPWVFFAINATLSLALLYAAERAIDAWIGS